MRKALLMALVLVLAGTAYAELQNVEIGGQIEIRGRMHRNTWNSPLAPEIRVPGFLLPYRAIGRFAGGRRTPQRLGVTSMFDWDDANNEWNFYETTTSLHVKADFTDNVAAMIEFYDTHTWGEDFRSNYITGADSRANTADDLEILQSYIEVNEMMDMPLRMRVGRQILHFGKGFLVAEKYSPTQRQAFDAIRLTYDQPTFVIDAWASKLADTSPVEEDGDVDFYGVYATYKGLDYLNASLYWMWLRDARRLNDTNFIAPLEWLEDVFDLDDYDPTNLHTIGTRLWGGFGGFDYDIEAAYQTGNADSLGFGFKPFLYGDDDAEYDNWAVDGEIGYTFDVAWTPRVMLGGAWYEGEDNRDVTMVEWLNPFHRPEASVSFNRLFSGINYCPGFQDNAWMTNFKQVRTGVSFNPTEKLSFLLRLQSLWADETFDWPAYLGVASWRIPIAPALPFLTEASDDHMGYSSCFLATYRYSEELTFRFYWGHFFAEDGVTDGNYVFFNGTDFSGGTDDQDSDYLFFWIILKF